VVKTNTNTLIIVFSVISIEFLVVFTITNNILGIAIVTMFSLFSLVIHERLSDIEDLLRRYRGN